MAFVKVASLTTLKPGSVMQAEVGENTYAVCNIGGEVHVFDGVCPHAGGPLGEGTIEGDNLVCPWHGWAYNCRTGVNDFDDAVVLVQFPVKTQGDDILADLPAS
jgi:nitrite reductase/ring-hydroxylating ferredoxin subunit